MAVAAATRRFIVNLSDRGAAIVAVTGGARRRSAI
jgi:hypothetical protein